MADKNTAWRADPLTWGHGPKVFEVFLEPTCPFSAKAFGKLDETLQSAGADRITLRIWLHSQPWHLFSGVITRCVLAASTLGAGKDAARKVLAGVANHRDQYEPADHCSGPLLDLSPADVIARVEDHSGLKLAEAYALPTLDREVKRHTKYARQNGIHVSPTFMIDGLVQGDMSSGDAVSAWVARLSGN
ncbi:DsbA family protein [Reyranella sp.]|uniref:DsbA family protein n=1 Tax=Reyranella sp. TaxID=1929291 RepID=UPI003BAB2517